MILGDPRSELQFNKKIKIKAETLLVRVVVAVQLNGGCSPLEVIDVVLLKQ